MSSLDLHDTLYAPFGGFIANEGSKDGVLLKKEYTSVVYCPKFDEKEPGAMYPRAIVLNHNGKENGKILATFECYSRQCPVYPIYESNDQAHSWKKIGEIEDKELEYGCRYQPQLLELPYDSGDMSKGTILCAGNIIPDDSASTSLRLYQSVDCGKTWKYVSEIVNGGKAFVDIKTKEKRPVWEPFLIVDPTGLLYCFYSDERYAADKGYNQLLAHKISKDGGKTWGEEKIDVAFSDGKLRPGMPVIAELPNHQYLMVYEMVNQDRIPVYFRISSSLDDWGDIDFIGNPVIAEDGRYLTGTPYVTWIPQGGRQGTILVSGRGFSHIMTNSNGASGFWKVMETLLPLDNQYGFVGYSQCLVPLDHGSKVLNLSPVQISDKLAMIEAAVADVYVRA